jgi:hypothetical protein
VDLVLGSGSLSASNSKHSASDDLEEVEPDNKTSRKRSSDMGGAAHSNPLADSGSKRKHSKSSANDEVFDDEGGSTPPIASQSAAKAVKQNPFKARASQLKRAGSSGGVQEALARIEAGGRL